MEEAPEGAYEVLWDDLKGGDIMVFEYLASVQSAVRRFNYRMETIAKNLGADSPIIEDMKANLDVNFSGNYRIKNGVPQLIKPGQIYKDQEMNNAMRVLDETVPTWGEIRKDFEPQYERYTEQEQFFGNEPVELPKFISVLMSIPEKIKIASDQNITDALDILRVRGRKKTYAELQRVAQLVGV